MSERGSNPLSPTLQAGSFNHCTRVTRRRDMKRDSKTNMVISQIVVLPGECQQS